MLLWQPISGAIVSVKKVYTTIIIEWRYSDVNIVVSVSKFTALQRRL